ncbi:MAG: hypothetical protein OEW60_07980, partial [Thiovulaceae bacterium]|nr:hypothetical protein [Sulfurimonadaceae bacterium]
MKTLILVSLLVSSLVQAKMYVREYTYNASENDSKVSARKAALRQLQLLLIEEVGVTVRSRFIKKEKLKNKEFSKTIDAKYESFSQAITKSKILAQKWDGEKFYIKVEMDIDPKGVAKAIDTLGKPTQTEKERCREKEAAVKLSLKDLSSQKNIDMIVTDAIKYPFKLPCNRWHYNIISKFVHYDIYDPRYKAFLLKTLSTIKLPGEDLRANYIVDYLRLDKGISKEEWKVVFPAIKRTSVSRLRALVATVFSTLNDDTLDFMDAYLLAAKKGEVGLPRAVGYDRAVHILINMLDRFDEEYFEDYYRKYAKDLTVKMDRRTRGYLESRYFKAPTAKRLEIMIEYFQRQKPSKYVSDNLFSLIKRMKRESEKNAQIKKDYHYFISKTQDVMRRSFPLCPYKSGQVDRIEFMLQEGISSDMAPTVKQSAKMLFDEDYRKQMEYAHYLALMGEKAKSVEKKVIKRLRRIERDRFSGATNMQWDLITILGNIKTKTPE